MTPAQKAELDAANIRLIHVFHNQMDVGFPGAATDKLTILGLDGVFRVASQVTLQEINLSVGKQKVLVATGIDHSGKSYTFSNPVWQINGGGTLSNQGTQWTLTATEPGKWELTCTDPQVPGITGKATVLVAGVVLDGNGTLQVIGTGGDDKVSLSRSGKNALRVQASFLASKGHAQQFALDQVFQIEVYGGAGRDTLRASEISTPVMIDGGEGNDVLSGGRGDDLLVGGSGHDSISGGGGADVLLGGEGNDMLWGENGRDLLIGGGGRDRLSRRPAGGHLDWRQDGLFRSAAGRRRQPSGPAGDRARMEIASHQSRPPGQSPRRKREHGASERQLLPATRQHRLR